MPETNYGWGLPVSASTFSGDIDRGIYLIHTSMMTLFFVASAFFIYFLIKYKHHPEKKANYKQGKRWPLIIPVLVLLEETYLIFSYAIPTWSKVIQNFPTEQESAVIEIVAEQFAWNVHYPGLDKKFGRKDVQFVDSSNILGLDPNDPSGKDDLVTLNELHLPLGKPTIAYLSSKDVIHSFFIPEFRIKKDVVPGMRVPIWFEPTREGKYELGCAQLCGIGHTTMRADVIVQTPQDFEDWLTVAQNQ